METISLKELRLKLPEVVEKINAGKSFTVFKRSKPIFQINPIVEDDEGWETILDFTEIDKDGVPAEDILRALRQLAEEDDRSRR